MPELYDAILDALGGRPGAGDTGPEIVAEYGVREAPSRVARDVLGITGKLPAVGTARRREYESMRRQVAAQQRGERPARQIMRRIERSAKVGRLAKARQRGKDLRRKGGAVGIHGGVKVHGYKETRTFPAAGGVELDPEAWGRILDAGGPDAIAQAFQEEFGAAYFGDPGAVQLDDVTVDLQDGPT